MMDSDILIVFPRNNILRRLVLHLVCLNNLDQITEYKVEDGHMNKNVKENKKEKNNNLRYDNESDSLYFIIKKDLENNFIELSPGINMEFNEKGEIIRL